MAYSTKPIVNFAGGEASPLIGARIDVTQYYTLAKTLENMMVDQYGGAFRTQGTKFVKRVKTVSKTTRLIPFIFSTGDSYILEFGHQYIRFFADSGSVVESALNITDITKADPCVVTCNTSTLSNGDAIDIESVGGMTELNNKRFLVANKTSTTISLQDEDGNDIDSSGYTAYTSGGTIEAVYEISSPYDEDDLMDLKFTQQGDIMYITHRSYEQRKLSRFGSASWTLAVPAYDELDWPAFKDINVTAYTITPSGTTGDITLTASSGSNLFNANHVGSYWKISHGSVVGYVKITAFNSSTSVDATVISTLGGTTATDDWYEGAWSDDEGWPVDCTFYEQRLIYVRDLNIWGSEIEIYDSFDNGTDDDATEDTDPFKYTIGSNQVDNIEWCYATDVLVLGTAKGPFIASSGSDSLPITPTNISVKQVNEEGSSSVSPVRIGPFVYYAQRSNRKIGQLAYSLDYNAYETEDITYLNSHILSDGGGVVDMAVQQHPYNIMWCILDDGSIATMTRQIKENVKGWTRQKFADDVKAESIGIIPNGAEDQIWVVFRHTIDSQTVRYIEYFTPIEFGDQDNAFFVRCGLTYTGADTTTITGLEHLEGKEVAVFARGTVHINKTVLNGSITLEYGSNGESVHVGLPYTSTLETMDIESGANAGTSQGKVTHISKVMVRLYKSLGCKVGDGTTQDTVPFQKFGDLLDTAPDLYTGDKEVSFPSGHVKNKYIQITQEQPLPLYVLGIFPTLMSNG